MIYIINLADGSVMRTKSVEVMKEFAVVEDYVIVNTDTNMCIYGEGEDYPVTDLDK